MPLGAEDLAGIEYVYRNFHRFGPDDPLHVVDQRTPGRAAATPRSWRPPTRHGTERTYLATEAELCVGQDAAEPEPDRARRRRFRRTEGAARDRRPTSAIAVRQSPPSTSRTSRCTCNVTASGRRSARTLPPCRSTRRACSSAPARDRAARSAPWRLKRLAAGSSGRSSALDLVHNVQYMIAVCLTTSVSSST